MNALIRAIDLELELMGDFADTQVLGRFSTIRSMLDTVKEYLTPRGWRDSVSILYELWQALICDGHGPHGLHWETTMRLMALEERIKKEWRFTCEEVL